MFFQRVLRVRFFSNLRANFFRPRVSGPVSFVEDVNKNLHSTENMAKEIQDVPAIMVQLARADFT